ncbi:hypothetical protein TNCT_657271 [Trichonephila clavata]|uniref:Uncharacterized protein n=1 Tax=Trichonephila clavata TaxID=2740835 RepID=A0A8X6F273_TRICU|nr:hypothetical protein TNCT_657271 [Trichonephila clavata]
MCAVPTVPGGAPFSMWFLKFTLGESITGGTEFPIEFILQIIVILVPHSHEVMLPTCFLPLGVVDDTTLDIIPVPDLQKVANSDTESVALYHSLNKKH